MDGYPLYVSWVARLRFAWKWDGNYSNDWVSSAQAKRYPKQFRTNTCSLQVGVWNKLRTDLISKMDLKAVNYTRNSILMFERVLNTLVGVMLLALTQLYWQVPTQLTFSCSKSTIKTLKKGVKYVKS